MRRHEFSQAAIDQWGRECLAFAELMATGALDRFFFREPDPTDDEEGAT